MNVEQARAIAKGLDMLMPTLGEAICKIGEKLANANFNWITGQLANAALVAEFQASDYAAKVDAIHAASGWVYKVLLFKLAFPKSGFKTFWVQFGINDIEQRQAARGGLELVNA